MQIGKKVLILWGTLSFILNAISCNLPTSTPEIQEEQLGKNIEENASLFEKHGKTYIFDTNDTSYIKPGGYTLWARTHTINSYSNFKVKLTKTAGQSMSGYGIVFNETKSGTLKHSMLCVLINLEGKYAIGKIENGKYKNIQWWQEGYEESTTLNRLQKGLGAQNTVEIRYNFILHQYELWLNGYKIRNFEDTRTQPVQTGRRGYVVVLSANEDFPTRNVRVEFEEEE